MCARGFFSTILLESSIPRQGRAKAAAKAARTMGPQPASAKAKAAPKRFRGGQLVLIIKHRKQHVEDLLKVYLDFLMQLLNDNKIPRSFLVGYHTCLMYIQLKISYFSMN